VAGQLAGLDRHAHTQTKLRVRSAALVAIRHAIEADSAEFASRPS